jgi:hypothetical protein
MNGPAQSLDAVSVPAYGGSLLFAFGTEVENALANFLNDGRACATIGACSAAGSNTRCEHDSVVVPSYDEVTTVCGPCSTGRAFAG